MNGYLTPYARHLMLPSTLSVMLSLHTDDPGHTGENEYAGGSYSRQSAVFGIPKDNGDPIVPSTYRVLGDHVTFFGVEDDDVAWLGIRRDGAFIASLPLPAFTAFFADPSPDGGGLLVVLNTTRIGLGDEVDNAVFTDTFAEGLLESLIDTFVNEAEKREIHWSLHTDNPGDDGVHEYSGTGPAGSYVRRDPLFEEPNGSVVRTGLNVLFGGEPGASVPWLGLWELYCPPDPEEDCEWTFLGAVELGAGAGDVSEGSFCEDTGFLVLLRYTKIQIGMD